MRNFPYHLRAATIPGVEKEHQRELAVCGRAAVRALSEKHPEKVRRLFFIEDRAPELGRLCSFMAKKKRPYRVAGVEDLEKLSDTIHHQGVVAMIEAPEYPRVSGETVDRWSKSGERVFVLDRVGNAHNLGAIVRSLAFFGLEHLVIGDDDGDARVTTSAYRVAQGGMELVTVWKDKSAAAFAQRAKGKIALAGADHRASASSRDLAAFARKPDGSPRAVAVLLGNEEEGLSRGARGVCDTTFRIPGVDVIESLNVAQAASILAYELAPRVRVR